MRAEAERGAMERALALAAAHRPHPNPRVGAVVLTDQGLVVGEGAHVAPGRPHAEVLALAAAGEKARGGTLVVTLEPCIHEARTPPCTDAVLRSGPARVVVGMTDPDRRVAGAGIERLREAGIEVEVGLLADRVEALDPGYFHHRRRGRSRLVLKQAATLDGQAAPLDGTSRWITGEEARADAHRLRGEVDAVLIGAGTLRADDPRLDVRLPGYDGPQPRPVVVAGRQPLPVSAALWDREALVVATAPAPVPATTLVVDPDPDGLPDLVRTVVRLGDEGLLEVLVEAGPTLAGALWRGGLVDAGVLYVGARLAGGAGLGLYDGPWPSLEQAVDIEITDVRRLGDDLRIDWRPRS